MYSNGNSRPTRGRRRKDKDVEVIAVDDVGEEEAGNEEREWRSKAKKAKRVTGKKSRVRGGAPVVLSAGRLSDEEACGTGLGEWANSIIYWELLQSIYGEPGNKRADGGGGGGGVQIV